MSLSEKRERLVDQLISEGVLKTKKVIKAFRNVKRELFIPEKYRELSYLDQPISIGKSQTISAPHMVAIMTELLEPKKTDKVLEVGAGSGYQSAILSGLVKEIWTIELIQELAEKAKESVSKAGYKNVNILVGDGSKGLKKEAPFDKVIVTCACPKIPKALITQLKEGGILLAPVGGGWTQQLIKGVKKKGKLVEEKMGGVVFVPLRH